MRVSILFAFAALTATFCHAESPADQSAVRLVTTISLDAVQGRIDHMALDTQGKRLYVAALGNNTVEVIDLEQGKRTGRIEGLKKPQGVAVLPESDQLVVASGEDGKCRKYAATQKLLGTIDSLDDADNVRYDPTAKHVYVGYGDGALAVIDAEKFARLASIKLAGHPEAFQLETTDKRIFVNVPDAGHVAVVDREKRAVIATWPINEAQANFPMALDEPHHRLFVGCRKPAKLLVVDTENGKTLAALDCCGDTDDVFYDGANRRVYVVGGEGCVSIFSQVDADTYKLAEKVTTAPGARTALFSRPLGRLFVAVPRRGAQPAQIRVYEALPALP